MKLYLRLKRKTLREFYKESSRTKNRKTKIKKKRRTKKKNGTKRPKRKTRNCKNRVTSRTPN
jgi:hypothetical protein